MDKELLNKIHLGDCLEFMKQLPDKSIDLVLTDPPYGIGASVGFGRSQRISSKIIKKDSWDNEIPSSEIFNEINRISTNQIIWGGNYFPLPVTRCFYVWDKLNAGRDFADCEMAWTNYDKVARMYQLRVANADGVGERFHPTQKPLRLFKWCLQQSGLEKGTVLDCFSGSGTTALACHDLGLDFICIEKDPDYHAASVKRLEEHKRQMRLL